MYALVPQYQALYTAVDCRYYYTHYSTWYGARQYRVPSTLLRDEVFPARRKKVTDTSSQCILGQAGIKLSPPNRDGGSNISSEVWQDSWATVWARMEPV